MTEHLSHDEAAAAIAAIHATKDEKKNTEAEDFKNWFDAAFLPILKDFAALTGSKLTIQQDSFHDVTATLASRCGFDITTNSETGCTWLWRLLTISVLTDGLIPMRWNLRLIFGLPENEE